MCWLARAPHSHAHRVSSASVGFFNPGLGSHSDPGEDTYSSESRRRRQSLGTVAELSALAQNTFGPVITPPTLPLQLLQFSFNGTIYNLLHYTLIVLLTNCKIIFLFQK